MPTLSNLTARQKQLADLIWSCESQEDVHALIKNLPREYRKDAKTILNMIVIECIDDEVTDEDHCTHARELLLKYNT
jgi:hypothetical protein